MRSLFLVIALLNVYILNAQTYYWVGGPGNWTDLNHWAACSGCIGNTFIQVPQSYNDVIIDENSGFTTISQLTDRIITLNTGGANVTFKNLSINPNVPGFRFSGNIRMDVYGNMELHQVNLIQGLWNGSIHFLGENVHHHFFNATRLNATINLEPTNGTHNFDNYTNRILPILILVIMVW